MANNTYCSPPKTILRPKPKADGTLMFNGNDVTGKFPTKFTCEQKPQQLMYNDDDWCNIYHVCAGPRDNIFICPPGTVFSKEKQGCFDRYTQQSCSGNINYYKPNLKKPSTFGLGSSSSSSSGGYNSNQVIPTPAPIMPMLPSNFEFVYPGSNSYQSSYNQPQPSLNLNNPSSYMGGVVSSNNNVYPSSNNNYASSNNQNQYMHNFNSNYNNMGYNWENFLFL